MYGLAQIKNLPNIRHC